ncbi:MAG: bacteriohemerythrin [Gallionella sp.]|nr:bacteriohemerythrin [Gallionella sp.]MDD4947366.1 bacteriohemerythrin [Gallionella sp.]
MINSKIDIFPWDDNFNTGIPKIDEQHKKLVQLINMLAGRVAFGAEAHVLDQVLDELAAYAVYHFETEEAIWHEYLAEDSAESAHRDIHNSFVQQVVALKTARISRPISEIAEEALGFLARWLASHILESDRYMAYAVLARMEGLSLDAAKLRAKEQMSGTTRALIDIILAIYSTLSVNTLNLMRELATHRQDKAALLSAQQGLQESESNLQTFFDTIDDFLFVLDGQGKIIEVNRTVLDRLGYSESDLIGLNVLKVHPEDRHEDARRVIAEMLSGKGNYCPVPLQAADGHLIPVETRVVAGQWNGQPALFGVSRDISERIAAEQRIAEQASLLEQYFDHSLNALALLDRDFNFIRVNAAYARADERDISEFPGHNHFDFYPSDARAIFEEVVKSRQPFQAFARPFEYAAHPERGVSYWDITLVPLLNIRGEADHLLLSLYDVTDQKRVEQALSDSRNLLQTVIDAVPMRIFWKDRESRYLGCNPLFARDAGKSTPDELLGRDDHDMGWAEQAELYQADDRQVMESGVAKLNYEEPQTTPDGQAIWLRTSKVPLCNVRGETIGILGLYDDVTEQKKAVVQLGKQYQELLRWQEVMLNREDRVLELKREVNELLARLDESPRYGSAVSDKDKP